MTNQWDVLVASSHVENRVAVVSALRRLPVNVISCAALQQAEEVLARQTVALVFCDESLSDGSFRELLDGVKREKTSPKVVVAIRTGDWKEYLEAMQLGAFDAIRCPLRETEIENVVARAMREERAPINHNERLGQAGAY